MIELLVVVAIISILAALLLPTLNGVRDRAHGARCMSNLRQIYLATLAYVDDNNGYLPVYYVSQNVRWWTSLGSYLGHGGPLDATLRVALWRIGKVGCPSALRQHPEKSPPELGSTYGMNYFYGINTNTMGPVQFSLPIKPPATCLVGDGHWKATGLYWNDHLNQGSMPDPVHSGGPNVLYFDGHVELIQWAAVPPVVSTPEGKAFWLGQ